MGDDNVIDEWFSFLSMTVVVLLLITPFIYSYNMLLSTISGKTLTTTDKTAVVTVGELDDSEYYMTKEDVLLSLVVVDQYMLTPHQIEINGVTIKIDTAFMENRVLALRTATAAMESSTKLKRELACNNQGMICWRYSDV